MKDIRLTIPEGYFEKSLEKTIASAERIRKRRRAILYSCAAVVLLLGTYFSVSSGRISRDEEEYLAQQAEMARLDIFLEINR